MSGAVPPITLEQRLAAAPPRAAVDFLAGHRQIADAYLLGLARKHGGTLATLDRGVRGLAGASGNLLELIEY